MLLEPSSVATTQNACAAEDSQSVRWKSWATLYRFRAHGVEHTAF